MASLPNEVFLVVTNADDPEAAHMVAYASWSKRYCQIWIARSGERGKHKVVGPYLAAQQASKEPTDG